MIGLSFCCSTEYSKKFIWGLEDLLRHAFVKCRGRLITRQKFKPTAVNIEPAICNGHLLYPWGRQWFLQWRVLLTCEYAKRNERVITDGTKYANEQSLHHSAVNVSW